MGLGAVMAVSLGAMLGSGIFVLPSVGVQFTGPSLWLAYLCAALCVCPAALSKSELASAMPTSGGTYVYLDRAFGPLAGTVGGLGLYLSLLLKAAFALVGFGAYLGVFFQHADAGSSAHFLQLVALGTLAVIVVLNVLGVGKVSGVLFFSVVLSVLSLLGLVFWGGVEHWGASYTRGGDFFAYGTGSFVSAVSLVFVAFAGVTKVAAVAEEVREPEKNISRGILLSLLVAGLLYCGVSFMLVWRLGEETLSQSLKPVYYLAQSLGGDGLGLVFAGVAILTMASMANAGILAASRFPFAMARDNLLPHFFGTVSARYLTPIWSIVASGILVAVGILLLDVEKMAKLASAFMIIIYAVENIAVIVLRETHVHWYKPKFRASLYPWAQLFGIFSAGVLACVMGYATLLALAGVGVLGAVLYVLFGRHRVQRRGVLGLRWPGAVKDDAFKANVPTAPLAEVSFSGDTQVVIFFLGPVSMPRTLVHVGLALAGKGKLDVVHVTEIPEQAHFSDVEPDQGHLGDLMDYAKHFSDEDLEFHPVVSHDVVGSMQEFARKLRCRWVLTPWGSSSWRTMSFHNPTFFLQQHVPCNLVCFKNDPSRPRNRFKKILVLAQINKPCDSVLQMARCCKNMALRGEGASGANSSAHSSITVDVMAYASTGATLEDIDFTNSYLHRLQVEHADLLRHVRVFSGGAFFSVVQQISQGYDLLIFEDERKLSLKGKLLEWLRPSAYDRLMESPLNCAILRLKVLKD